MRPWASAGIALYLGLVPVSAALAQTDAGPVESVTVTGAKAAPEKALSDFISSFTAPSPASGKVARWQVGICPGVVGLPDSWSSTVVTRLRDVATLAGAPVAAAGCRPNIDVVFTNMPQALLDQVRATKSFFLGFHDRAQEKDLATVRHAIQSWYMTQTVDARGSVYVDDKLHTQGIWLGNSYYPDTHVEHWSGTHLADEKRSEISHVLVVVDLAKVNGIRFSAVMDYLAMLTLSQTTAFETCQPLASIANLMAPACDTRLKPDAISAGDLAYLKALYSVDPHGSLGQQKSSMAFAMKKTFGAPAPSSP